MFMTYAPTPFDITFRLFGFIVRVHPLFWLIMALLGDWTMRDPDIGPFAIVIWVACGFFSILLHELGHAVFIRKFGSPTEIVLYGFGGLATVPYPPSSPWKRLMIALGGPLTGLAFAALLLAVQFTVNVGAASPYFKSALLYLLLMNIIWNLLNLLPIWPLDGGRICRELLEIVGAREPDRIALTISVGVAGIFALYGFAGALNVQIPILEAIMPFRPSIFMCMWLIVLALDNYQALQMLNRRRQTWDDDRSPWER